MKTRLCIISIALELILSMLFPDCSGSKQFSEVGVGDFFYVSRDAKYQRLPDNYCLFVDTFFSAYLFQVPSEDENITVQQLEKNLFNNYEIILHARYIKGGFNETDLVLVEEKEDQTIQYIVFHFENGTYKHIATEEALREEYPDLPTELSSLCTPKNHHQ